ncbi:MAG: S-adenosyl-l-methionine hydroxide adenosyltransferase family protein [Desulfurella sp.]
MQTVVFLSDFGYLDPYVGIVKGVIKSNCNAEIIDLSHNIYSFSLKSAQFILKYSYKYFPQGSIFLVVVDPEVGSYAKPIVVKRENYTFVGRDNGILTFDNNFEVYSVDEEFKSPSATFHARDIFSKIVCKIIKGDIKLTKIEVFEKFDIEEVVFTEGEKQGEVLWIDKFGNIITNIKTESDSYELVMNGFTIEKKAKYYAEFNECLFAIKGSFGFLEISIYKDSAACILNAKIGDSIIIRSKR